MPIFKCFKKILIKKRELIIMYINKEIISLSTWEAVMFLILVFSLNFWDDNFNSTIPLYEL